MWIPYIPKILLHYKKGKINKNIMVCLQIDKEGTEDIEYNIDTVYTEQSRTMVNIDNEHF